MEENNNNFNIENCGYDITIGTYNGEEIRRAYEIKPWPKDQEINNLIPSNDSSTDTHEYVDLGLSVKWATCNIGANTQYEDGMYFAWGETQGYTAEQIGTDRNFNESEYKFGRMDWMDSTNFGMTKYNNSDRLTELEPDDDAAIVNWGNGWRMPTNEEFEELISGTTHEFDTENNGVIITSKSNGNTIFLPFAGKFSDGSNDYFYNKYCFSLTSSLGDGMCFECSTFCANNSFDDNGQYVEEGFSVTAGQNRWDGFTIRPVYS